MNKATRCALYKIKIESTYSCYNHLKEMFELSVTKLINYLFLDNVLLLFSISTTFIYNIFLSVNRTKQFRLKI